MKDKDIRKVLEVVLGAVEGEDFDWRLEGSANLRVQEVEVEVHDLDVTTDKEGIDIFRENLKQFVVKDYFKEELESQVLFCNIGGFEVEVLDCRGDERLKMLDKAEVISWKGLEIPVLPFEYARRFYNLIGRDEKVKIIDEHLA